MVVVYKDINQICEQQAVKHMAVGHVIEKHNASSCQAHYKNASN